MKFIMLASMLLAFAAAAETMKATNGRDTVRLYDIPCVNLAVLSHIQPQWHAKLRKAEAIVNGKPYAACWIVDGDFAHLAYEDGDQGLVPLTDFKLEPDI